MKQLFATFSEDDEEQKQLNFKLAEENLTRSIANNKKLSEADYNLLKENKYPVDDALTGGKTASPVGDILGVGGGMAVGSVAIKNPLKTLSVIGAPNPNSPTFIDELSMEMVTQKGLPGSPFKGAKRIANLVSEIFPEQAQSTGRFFNQLFQKPNIVKQAEEIFSGRLFGVTGGDFPAISKKGFDPNITKKNLELFNQIGWTGTAKLDIQDMLYGIDDVTGKPLMSQYKRRVLKAGIGDETFNWGAFTKNRDAVVKDFLDGLQDLKIDPKTVHGHHISALRITSSLFDGLSPIQRKKLIKIFQKNGLQLGNHPKNLLALHQSTHLDVVHPFLEKQIGKYGQLLIDPAKIKKMTPKQREGLVKKFAKIIKKSEEIALNDTRKWLDKQFLDMSPEAAFQAKLGMLENAFDKEIALRKLLLDNIVAPRRTSKSVKLKNLMKKVEKRLKLDNIDSPKQLEIWDIDDNTLKMFSDLLNQNK